MKIAVYSYKDIEKPCYEGLEEKHGIELVFSKDMPTVENAKLAKGAKAVSVVTTHITEDVIQALYDVGVRYISTRTAGYDHIDIEKAKELDMGVGHATYGAGNVAEYALMLMLMACRKAAYIIDTYKKQDYSLINKQGQLLSSKTVGVIGTGRIGSELIKLLSGFGCEILASDPYENEELKQLVSYVSKEELFERSDVITLHAPATAENMHLINQKALGRMKDGVVIVNTSRGALIDTDALIEALSNGKVGFAALDVLEGETPVYYKNFEGQPAPLKHITELSQFENVLLTPHTAFFTAQAMDEMAKNSIQSCVLEIRKEKNPWKIV